MPTAMPLYETTDASEIERGAFNAAFHELGLRWHWCGDTYAALATDPCERSRVKSYLQAEQPHLLRAYDADFLAEAILAAKQRCSQTLAGCAPHALPRFNWADPRSGEIGV
jgi:hypothetical protein